MLEGGDERTQPWQEQAFITNGDVSPEKWALSCAQLFQFVKACSMDPQWSQIEKEKGYVSAYSVNETFVIPWTRGTGAGVALNMNAERPLSAELMISHAWKEDMREFQEALQTFMQKSGLSLQTPVWFCLLALYQASEADADKKGPSIKEQLKKDPFGCLIRIVPHHHGVLVVHTSKAEVYERLWCVYEMAEAVRMKCPTHAAFSDAYVKANTMSVLDIVRVHTKQAQCSVASDRLYIWKKVLKVGGFRELDARIFRFRLKALGDLFAVKNTATEVQRFEEEIDEAEKKLMRMQKRINQRRCALRWTARVVAAALIAFSVFTGFAFFSDDAEVDSDPDVLMDFPGPFPSTTVPFSTSTSSTFTTDAYDLGSTESTTTLPDVGGEPFSHSTTTTTVFQTTTSSTSTSTSTMTDEEVVDGEEDGGTSHSKKTVMLVLGITAITLLVLLGITIVMWHTVHHGFSISMSSESDMPDIKQRLEETKRTVQAYANPPMPGHAAPPNFEVGLRDHMQKCGP